MLFIPYISPYLFDERASALKFHTAWPGFDPMYEHDTLSSQTRVLHYAVFGVPQALLNGKAYAENCSWPGQPSCIKDDLLERLAVIFGNMAIGHLLDSPEWQPSHLSLKTDH
jgi:hypothetical protein